MKTNRLNSIRQSAGETIARFGQARLIRRSDGHHELLGGTAADRGDARDWCSFFAPEVVYSTASPSDCQLAPVASTTSHQSLLN